MTNPFEHFAEKFTRIDNLGYDSEVFTMIPEAGERQHHTVTDKWRVVCNLCDPRWTSDEHDTAELVDLAMTAHFENTHNATEVIPTP